MKIVADPNIAFVQEAFSEFGKVRLIPSRHWTAAQARNADILLIRSVTRVDARLIEGSKVKFVGSATSGVDHVDVDYLARQGIAFASALGSNANAAAEYVLSAILFLLEQRGGSLANATAGIIGYGHVGSRVVQLLRVLGIPCVVNDPPRQEATDDDRFAELEEVISADVVSLHVPLTRIGKYPTYRMVDKAVLSQMKSDAIVINTARGGVMDEKALIKQLDERPAMRAVVDCWEGEPDINTELLARVSLGTAHIAGYSFDAKVKATEMLYAVACEHFDRPLRWHPPACWSASSPRELRFLNDADDEALIRQAVLSCYDIGRDSAALKRLLSLPATERAGSFDELRRRYPVRREFSQTDVLLPANRPRLAATLTALGFRVK